MNSYATRVNSNQSTEPQVAQTVVEHESTQGDSMSKFTSVPIDQHVDGQELTSPVVDEASTTALPASTPTTCSTSKMGIKTNHKKYLSLVVLVVQNTALVLTMRYSRTVTTGPMYLASTAVVLTELLKFVICVSMIFHGTDCDVARTLTLLKTEIIDKKSETLRLSVPSVLYTIQNNLLYIALSHLDAATFQVTYQLKILTTALFSVLLLGRTLNKMKWVSLVVLMFAVALVQWPTDSNTDSTSGGYHSSVLIGVGAVLLACVSSGFSGVYIEKVLKQSDTSMWIRNIQLSLLSFFIGLCGVFFVDFRGVLEGGFFQGYSLVVLVVITLQALGGLVVAAVMKFADNILKGFATSVSIVISSLVSYFFLSDFTPSWFFIVGSTLVLTATFMYSRPPTTQLLPSSTSSTQQNSSHK